jgi:hypothetical protein
VVASPPFAGQRGARTTPFTALGKAADKPARAEESHRLELALPLRRSLWSIWIAADLMYQADASILCQGVEPASRSLSAPFESDDRPLDRLGELIDRLDPVPASVLADASALFESILVDFPARAQPCEASA